MKTLGRYFDKLWNWIVYSSANPLQISSTIKWASGVFVTFLTIVFGFGHVSFPTEQLTALVDPTIQAVQLITLGLTTLGTVIAGLRKIYLTIRRQNIKTAPPTTIEG